ncbi:MAG: NAD(P)H-quinone oxidoreductase [Proteobacteria bacterium]|nr:NAD(P)H-quinone oxidoreductase [Pseudomonadota bacterium]HQR02839.1 NAD(P)H-quinone oxidoreductase [Rhodocyclaceae bacterium]
MKFIGFDAPGEASVLHLKEGSVPVPEPGDVLIRVAYAGVNRPDLLQRAGAYPPPPGVSPVLGLEVSGWVAAVGDGVTEWRTGDRVAALVPGGGYAEFCLAPAGQVLPVPEGIGLDVAAGLPENWFTVWHNLMDLGHLQTGERLLVHGAAGGIGLAALQLGRLVGAEVFATASSSSKLAMCAQYGATWCIDSGKEDFVERIREITSRSGVDVVLDILGGNFLQKNVSLLRQDGRHISIAFLEGSRVEFDFMTVMMRRLVMTGSTMRPRSIIEKTRIRNDLLERVWPALTTGRVGVHLDSTFPLNDAAAAHRRMESRGHIGKILLHVAE